MFVDGLVVAQSWVLETGLCLAVKEAGAAVAEET